MDKLRFVTACRKAFTMKKKLNSVLITAAVLCALTFLIQPMAEACTGIQLETEDGVFVSGRTLEFGISFKKEQKNPRHIQSILFPDSLSSL